MKQFVFSNKSQSMENFLQFSQHVKWVNLFYSSKERKRKSKRRLIF